MDTQYTPGPWADGLHYQGQLAIQADNGRLIALCGKLSPDDMQLENQANARLIAAAPELLAALQGRHKKPSFVRWWLGKKHETAISDSCSTEPVRVLREPVQQAPRQRQQARQQRGPSTGQTGH